MDITICGGDSSFKVYVLPVKLEAPTHRQLRFRKLHFSVFIYV